MVDDRALRGARPLGDPDPAVREAAPEEGGRTVTLDHVALVGRHGAPISLRTLVPDFEVVDDPDFGPSLRWERGRGALSEDQDESLWRLVELDGAPDATIAAFARRFGVLAAVPAPAPPRSPQLEGWTLAAGAEPLAAWRAVAAGCAAMLDLATELVLPSDTGAAPQQEQVVSARHAILTVQWLLTANRLQPMPRREDAAGHWEKLDVADIGPEGEVRSGLWWWVNRLLAEARVQPLVDVVPAVEAARYALPALELGLLERPPQRRGRQYAAPDEYWRLPALLPILSVDLARAVAPGEFERCAYCGRLARIEGRRPDRRRAWFGDHDYCRGRSRTEVMREVNKRYRARLAGQASDD